jgi:uncharacterized protein YggE
MFKLQVCIVTAAVASLASAQIAGGAGTFGRGGNGALNQELGKRGVRNPPPPDANSTFVDASVLLNRRADEYVAVFGISQEGKDIKDARSKIDSIVEAFVRSLASLGVLPADVYVDFVSQNRVYGFQVEADTAREEIVGFEVKKNIAIHYKSAKLIDRLTDVASEAGIFDLIKVNYLVKDVKSIQKQLMVEAGKVVKEKIANRASALGIKAGPVGQIYTEDYASYYPTEMYSTYVAAESQEVIGYRPNLVTIMARKSNTAYFDPLGQQTFDTVINPVVTEPVVQFTLYLRVRYGKAPTSKK